MSELGSFSKDVKAYLLDLKPQELDWSPVGVITERSRNDLGQLAARMAMTTTFNEASGTPDNVQGWLPNVHINEGFSAFNSSPRYYVFFRGTGSCFAGIFCDWVIRNSYFSGAQASAKSRDRFWNVSCSVSAEELKF